MNRQKLVKLIPLGIAVLLSLITIVSVLMTPNTINEKGETVHYVVAKPVMFASFGLIIVLIFLIQKKNYWKHAFGFLLLLATTSIIQFSYQTFSFGIAFIQIELTALVLLVFHLKMNKDVLRDTRLLFKTTEKEKEQIGENKIKSFQQRFASKDQEELQRIVDEDYLVPEAVEAARRLLFEQKKRATTTP